MASSDDFYTEQKRSNRRIAERLLAQGSDTSPVQHWTQGAARIMQALTGGYGMHQADERDRERDAAQAAAFGQLPGMMPAEPAAAPSQSGGWMDAIKRRADEMTGRAPMDSQPGFVPGGNVSANVGPQPASIRTNNPGAQYPGPSATAYGSTGHDVIGGGHKIARFDDPVSGGAAQFDLLNRNYTGMTVDAALNKWTGGNSSPQTRAAMARAAGLSPDTPITPDLLRSPQGMQFAQAMARNEAGRDFPMPAGGWQEAQARGLGGQGGAAPAARDVPSIPPQVQQQILALARNPATRPMAAQLYQQYSTPQKLEKLNEETLFDPRSGRTMRVGESYRPLTDAAERARFGIPADDKRPYQLGPGGKLFNPPPETRVSIDQRGESEFTKSAAGVNAKYFGEVRETGRNAVNAIASLDSLREIGSRITTGKTAEMTAMLGPWAEAAGIKIEGLSDLQAYNSIVRKMAPTMRPAGSGSTSDFEMRQYLEGLPGLGKTAAGNEIIANTNQALLEHHRASSDIASRALAGEISTREAEKMLRELPDPMAMWKQSRGASPAAAGSGTTKSGIKWSVE